MAWSTTRAKTFALPAIVSLCLLFGLAEIVNIHPAGDGMWFWYARLERNGAHLYSELRFPLQPLFVLLTASFQGLFGMSWIASKILPVVQLCTYLLLLGAISCKADIGNLQRALLVSGTFFLGSAASYYRFDDYHVTSDVLVLLALYLLLRTRTHGYSPIARAIAVGGICGLCVTNRANDGATLLVGCLSVFLLVRQGSAKARLAATCLLSAALSTLIVVLLTHDTLSAWLIESILNAAAIKGGSGGILFSPLMLPYRLIVQLATLRALGLVIYACVFGLCLRNVWRASNAPSARGLLVRRSAALLITVCCVCAFVWQSRNDTPLPIISELGALALYFMGIGVVIRACAHLFKPKRFSCRPEEVLLLIPFGQLLAASFTSARTLPDVHPSVSAALLLSPVIYFGPNRRRIVAIGTGLCAAITLSAIIAKTFHPYSWHNYGSARLFAGREWYRHPIYGPMYIESKQLRLFQESCSLIAASTDPHELLSLPYPYMNYFCGIAPWHNYVQTWYDTAGPRLISQVAADLANAPPEWISYQHDRNIIRIHENAFHNGHPLAHRLLDKLITHKLMSGEWDLESRECLNGSDWLLIRTVPARPGNTIQQSFRTQQRGFCGRDYDDLNEGELVRTAPR